LETCTPGVLRLAGAQLVACHAVAADDHIGDWAILRAAQELPRRWHL